MFYQVSTPITAIYAKLCIFAVPVNHTAIYTKLRILASVKSFPAYRSYSNFTSAKSYNPA